jgi:hypothetical protein
MKETKALLKVEKFYNVFAIQKEVKSKPKRVFLFLFRSLNVWTFNWTDLILNHTVECCFHSFNKSCNRYLLFIYVIRVRLEGPFVHVLRSLRESAHKHIANLNVKHIRTFSLIKKAYDTIKKCMQLFNWKQRIKFLLKIKNP